MMLKKKQKIANEETTYWLSYSDMMAALLLVFVLIISFTMLQAKLQLKATQDELDQIKNTRQSVVNDLKDEFGDSLIINEETGTVEFDSSVLFDTAMYNIKPSGQEALREFLPRYFEVLLKHRDNIQEIIIEGHTDSEGEYLYNLDLSQKRAMSVAQFCLNYNNGFLSNEDVDELRSIVTANGRSYSALKYINDDVSQGEDKARSRRVEFKFRLKDEDLRDQMQDILDEKGN